VPARNGSPPEAPAGGHSTQWGATADALAGDAVEEAAPAPLAAATLAEARGPADADRPALAEEDVAAVDVPAVDVPPVNVPPVDVAAAGAIAGRLTAPDDPDVCAVPATGGAVDAV
jgi:hypothetical protein